MVLKCKEVEITSTKILSAGLEDFLSKYIRSSCSSEFLENGPKELQSKDGVVYVGQSEAAILSPNQCHGLKYLGSEDATTCHIIVLHCKNSGKFALAHLDSVLPKGLSRLTQQICDDDQDEIDFHVFGGYQDERDISQGLSISLLKYLIHSHFNYKLGYCVIGSHNTWFGDDQSPQKYPRPRLYGVAVNVHSGDIYPAVFKDKNPDPDLRHVRLSFRQFESSEEYHSVRDFFYQDFDEATGEFVIEPFYYGSSPDLPFICKASDKFILENMSTSPRVEPSHFCSSIRSAAKLILDTPDPKKMFPKGKPRRYIYSGNECKWIKLK